MSTRGQILPDGRILRYNFIERATHWVSAFSYIYLLLTGLAFWSPWLYWLAILCGGPQISRSRQVARPICRRFRFHRADARSLRRHN